MAIPMLAARTKVRPFGSILPFACVVAFLVAANPASAIAEPILLSESCCGDVDCKPWANSGGPDKNWAQCEGASTPWTACRDLESADGTCACNQYRERIDGVCTECSGDNWYSTGPGTNCSECELPTSNAELDAIRLMVGAGEDRRLRLKYRPAVFKPTNTEECETTLACDAGYGIYEELVGTEYQTKITGVLVTHTDWPFTPARCKKCADGQFAPVQKVSGTVTCTACPIDNIGEGTYEGAASSSADCANHLFCPRGAAGASCTNCSSGTYPIIAPRGYESNGDPRKNAMRADGSGIGKWRECKACPPLVNGTYLDGVVLESVLDCGANALCGPGFGSSNTSSSDNTCAPCENNEYSEGGVNAECKPCPDLGGRGYYYTNGATSEEGPDGRSCLTNQRCKAGYGGAGCQVCPFGTYSEVSYIGEDGNYTIDGDSGCKTCADISPNGQYVSPSQGVLLTSADSCEIARSCDQGYGGPNCTQCDTGEFSAGGVNDQDCHQCDAEGLGEGKWGAGGPFASQDACEAAWECDPGYAGAACLACDTGKFSAGGPADNVVCTDCPTLSFGSYTSSNEPLTQESECAPVQQCTAGYGGQGCVKCGANTYSDGTLLGIGGCMGCPDLGNRGSFNTDQVLAESTCELARNCNPGNNGEDDFCTLCSGTGVYSEGGQKPCKSCPTLKGEVNGVNLDGVYLAGVGVNASCETIDRSCSAGYGWPSCAQCDIGEYSTGVNSECTKCPDIDESNGEYISFGTSDTCQDARDCHAGFNGATTSCTTCQPGEYSLGGTDPCTDCPPLEWGYTAAGTEQTCADVRNCPAGRDGKTANCELCGSGTYSLGGSSGCELCEPLGERGSYETGPGTNATCSNVRKCNAGNNGGSLTCEACPAGQYSLGGTGRCLSCPTMNLNGGTYDAELPGTDAECSNVRTCLPSFNGAATVQTEEGPRNCHPCAAGEWSDGTASGCQSCPGVGNRGSHKFSDVESTCVSARRCKARYNSNDATCAICEPGKYSVWGSASTQGGTDGSCKECEDLEYRGSYDGAGKNDQCQDVRVCKAGFDPNTKKCKRCPPGKFSLGGKVGQPNAQCTDCPELGDNGNYFPMRLKNQDMCELARDCAPGHGGPTCEKCQMNGAVNTYSTGEELHERSNGNDYASSYNEKPHNGIRATCEDCPAAGNGWEYYGLRGLRRESGLGKPGRSCESDRVCSAGYGSTTGQDGGCQVCDTGKFMLGPKTPWRDRDSWGENAGPHSYPRFDDNAGERTPTCKSCEDEDLGKPPNSYYRWDGSLANVAKHETPNPACEYVCDGPYSDGWPANAGRSSGACDVHPLCPAGQFYTPRYNIGGPGGNGSCWGIQEEMATFEESRANCKRKGGDMVEVRSSDDQGLLRLVRDTYDWENRFESSSTLFFGLSDRLWEGSWSLLDGSLPRVDFWAADGEDDDITMLGEDCAILDGSDWRDITCAASQMTVCAIPTSPVYAQCEPCTSENLCHVTADCCKVEGVETCSCGAGMVGSGVGADGCKSTGWTVRFNMWLKAGAAVLQPNNAAVNSVGKLLYWEAYRDEFASLLTTGGFRTGGNNVANRRSLPAGFVDSMDHAVTVLDENDNANLETVQDGYISLGYTSNPDPTYMLTINAIFASQTEAEAALDELEYNLAGNQTWSDTIVYPTVFGVTLSPETYPVEPRVYAWTAKTTSAGEQVIPTGMDVESVHFQPNCTQSGCWVVDIIFTIGNKGFNTFFIPQAVGDDTLSYDFNYDDETLSYSDWDYTLDWGSGKTAWGTFFPNDFPCRTHDYDPEEYHPFKPVSAPAKVTSCCLPEMLDRYRPIQGFYDDISSVVNKADCDDGIVNLFVRPGQWNVPVAPGPQPVVGIPVNCTDNFVLDEGASVLGDSLTRSCYFETADFSELSVAYEAGDMYAWKIVGMDGMSTQLVFDFFEIREDLDHVKIYECNTEFCDDITQLAVGSGAYNPFAVTSSSGHMLVTFEADASAASSVSGKGLQGKWYPVPPTGGARSLRAPGENNAATNRVGSSGRTPVATPENRLFGSFKGLSHCSMTFVSVVDPYIGQFRARAFLDEVELRRNAGLLKGTVGVEHTVDTFIGYANFNPTGIEFLDPFATQANLHLEKTSFFSVSTHGVNEYTFLEYVNLRLVAIYKEDTDPTESVQDNTLRTNRTNPTGAAHYLQVTFTMGDQYRPIETGLIPLDSVRVAQGVFFDEAKQSKDGPAGFFHTCSQYDADDNSFDSGNQALFNSRFAWDTSDEGGATNQLCSPSAQMCVSPADVPDQFVVFNVPLGIDWLPAPSPDLSSNVFIDLVVSAIDKTQIDTSTTDPGPNEGEPPEQMKTTLSASIPVVAGGLNIFCDQITAKTDLQDVVNADLILGSAGFDSELSRLRILRDIANSDLDELPSQSFGKSDSIEAGLMTVVVKGNSSYFNLGGTGIYGVQLEDVITVHIMEAAAGRVNGDPASCVVGVGGGCTTAGNMMDQVLDLLEQPGSDNNDANGLLTAGYSLNGAFEFEIDRVQNRAYLEPRDALLALCPFNPARPTTASAFPTTCVIRRDIRRQAYPFRGGGYSTAVELPGELNGDYTEPSANRDQCGYFMQTIMGESDYAFDLGKNFSLVVAKEYSLNDRYMRAWWINPGYEWTPTQTGGQSIFTISQKIILFALINLDEGFDTSSALYSPSDECNYRLVGDPSNSFGGSCTRRSKSVGRRLLLTNLKNTDSNAGGLSGAQLTFDVSPRDLMANAFPDVPLDNIITVKVSMELTQKEACMSQGELRDHLEATMRDFFSSAASSTETVTLMGVSANRNGVECRRRTLTRKMLSAFSAATADVDVLAVFSAGTTPGINTDILNSMPGITGVAPIEVPATVTMSPDFVPDIKGGSSGSKTGSSGEEGGSADSNTALIAGLAGGLGGLVLLVVGGVLYWKSKGDTSSSVPVVQALETSSLKAQLQSDL